MRISRSRAFRIVRGSHEFEFDVRGVGVFRGSQDELLADLRVSGLPYLRSASWEVHGAYGISYKNLIRHFERSSELAGILNNYREKYGDIE